MPDPAALLRRPRIERDPIRDGTLLIGLLCAIGQVAGVLPMPFDGYLNWAAGGWLADLYPQRWYEDTGAIAFVYPPPLAVLHAALRALPFELYVFVLTPLLFWCLWYCCGRWTFAVLLVGVIGLLFPDPGPLGVPLGYALNGNIQLVLAVAVVMALRHPVAWCLPILTKIGPGVGLLWHVVRREWRALATALAATATVAAVTFLIAPQAWLDYIAFLGRNSDVAVPLQTVPVPWVVRLAMSAAVIAWGAATDRPWTVPIGVGWAMPALYPWSFIGIWLGAIRLSGLHEMGVRDVLRHTTADRARPRTRDADARASDA